MRFIGSKNCNSNIINKLHVSLKPCIPFFMTMFLLNGLLKMTNFFYEIKTPLSPKMQNSQYQPNTNNQMQVLSYNSRILTTQEQKLSTYDQILCFNFWVFSIRFYYHWVENPYNYFYSSESYSFSFYPQRKSHTETKKSSNAINKIFKSSNHSHC